MVDFPEALGATAREKGKAVRGASSRTVGF
jgi:hypothetical protein